MKTLALLLAFSSTPLLGATCSKTILTANKTDMRDELKKLKAQGWEPKGKLRFKDYAFRQVVVKQGKCDNEGR